MGQFIIHHKGAYNYYSTIVDAPLLEEPFTLDELTANIEYRFGQEGLRELPARLERAHKYGTSAIGYTSLEETIICNRAGDGETELTLDEFVARFLTLPDEETT
jgi:hypothetical protein